MASGTTFNWETIPEELLWMVFKHSTLKSLVSCMTVNRRWKDIAFDYIEYHSLWPKVATETMANEGRTFKRKSALGFKDMVMNSLLWPFVSQAEIILYRTYMQQDITSLQVLKETMILTLDTTDVPIRYFDIPNATLQKGLQSTATKLDVSENEYMRVIIEPENLVLYAYGKDNPNDPLNCSETLIFFKFDILVYRLEGNVCYLVTKRHIIWTLKWDLKTWILIPRGRYYGNSLDEPCGIALYNDKVCMITRLGFILCEEEPNLYQKQNNYNLVPLMEDSSVMVLFSQKGVAISVKDSDQRVKVFQEEGTNVVWLECGDMTCATEHGDVLFIGYKDGSVAICIPHTMTPANAQLERLFNVRELHNDIEDPAILAVEVFEDKLSHHLLVATRHKVLVFLITYPDHIRCYYD